MARRRKKLDDLVQNKVELGDPEPARPLFPEFDRNAQMQDLKYDRDRIAAQKVLVVGANETSEELINQLLVFGFQDIYLWDHRRSEDGTPLARSLLERVNHVSPVYRHKKGYESLPARAMVSSFDSVGMHQFSTVNPDIMIMTENDAVLSDLLFAYFMRTERHGLFLDVHTVQDHDSRYYGLNIQSALRSDIATFDQFSYIEHEKDLSLFDKKPHDPLMAVIAASYAASILARHVLDEQYNTMMAVNRHPASFSLFPFTEDPLEVGQSGCEVHYDGFFGDRGIYVAGLGGGSLIFDLLARIFNVNRIWGVDKDKLERTNMNRLVPLIDESLIGKPKTKAVMERYAAFAALPGKQIRCVDGVIYDSLLLGADEKDIDIIFGFLSGFDNKLNLISLSQKLAQEKPHLLVDVGVEPFRFDVTPYLRGITPCDYCRNLHDLAVTESISQNLPNCDRFPAGSTVFSNYLGALAIVEAMKHIDPRLGEMVSGAITGNLLALPGEVSSLYQRKDAAPIMQEECMNHKRTVPLNIRPQDYVIEEGMDKGWHMKTVYEKGPEGEKAREIGHFKYIPKMG